MRYVDVDSEIEREWANLAYDNARTQGITNSSNQLCDTDRTQVTVETPSATIESGRPKRTRPNLSVYKE